MRSRHELARGLELTSLGCDVTYGIERSTVAGGFLELPYVAETRIKVLNDSILSTLQACESIRTLEIYGNIDSDIANTNLRCMRSLERLDLTGVTNCDAIRSWLASQKHLEYLRITDTDFSGSGVRFLNKLQSLKHLDMSGAVYGDDLALEAVKLPALDVLWLAGAKVTDLGMRGILESNIRVIIAAGIQCGDACVSGGVDNDTIEVLDVSGTRFSYQGIRAIANGCNKLKLIDIRRTMVVASEKVLLRTEFPAVDFVGDD